MAYIRSPRFDAQTNTAATSAMSAGNVPEAESRRTERPKPFGLGKPATLGSLSAGLNPRAVGQIANLPYVRSPRLDAHTNTAATRAMSTTSAMSLYSRVEISSASPPNSAQKA